MLNAIETMNDLLGSDYHIVSSEDVDPVVIAKLPEENLAKKDDNHPTQQSQDRTIQNVSYPHKETIQPKEQTIDDYLFHFYIGSLTVVGLFVLFRMIQKSR